MNWEDIKNLAVNTIKAWIEDDAKTYSAALAYYFVLSLPALLLFSVSIGSIFLKSDSLQNTIINTLQGVVDESIIDMVRVLFENLPTFNSLSISALIAFTLLLWSASNFFRQLKNFLEKAWGVKSAETNGIKDFIRDVILSFLIVIFFGGLLSISIIIESLLYEISKYSQGLLPFPPVIPAFAGSVAFFLILVAFFMIIYRVLPDKSFNIKSIFVGSLVTVTLITIGKYLLGLYFEYSNPVSVYGAIGAIIGLFLLLYYSAIMITIGAEFTQVYAES